MNWEQYNLTDIPFLAVPQIRVGSGDVRVNGKLYYADFASDEVNNMLRRIQSESYPIIFLRTQGSMLGNGKSVFLSNIYWILKGLGSQIVWVRCPINPNIRQFLSNILDSMVTHNIFSELKAKLRPTSTTKIEKRLSAYGEKYGPSVLYSLNELIKAEPHELTRVYSNMKRRIPTADFIPIFGAFINLCYAVGIDRFVVFLDQFEDFVRRHGGSGARDLGLQFNRLLREIGENTTIIASIHTEAEIILLDSNADLETFINPDYFIELPGMEEEDVLGMLQIYFNRYRKKATPDDIFYPFSLEVIRYTCHRASMNPRRAIMALRASLINANLDSIDYIDTNFVHRYHKVIFGGYENKLDDFLNEKWVFDRVS
jgi:hypothetical protein